MTPRITCLLDARHQLGECPTWDERNNRLLWCDILGKSIHAMDWATNARMQWRFPSVVGSFGLTDDDRFVVALRDKVVLFDPQSGQTELLAEVETNVARTRLNDGRVGPDGAFWVGSMDERKPRTPIGALYRVNASGDVATITEGLYVSNGLAWSADGRTMYHADTGRDSGWVDKWRFDPETGSVDDRLRFADLSAKDGRPDGAAVDAKGNYWSAGVSAGVINVFSPKGQLISKLTTPVPQPTMPCFCGPDLTSVVVTSLQPKGDMGLMAKYPKSGGLFIFQAGVSGVPTYRFKTRA